MLASHFSLPKGHGRLAVCTVFLVLATLSRAQLIPRQQSNDGAPQNYGAHNVQPSTSRVVKKPNARKEEFWCSMIDSAYAKAAALEPAMRSFVLDSVASGLKKCDPSKVRKTLVDAFTASSEIPEREEQYLEQWETYASMGSPDPAMITARTNLETKRELQISALTDLLAVDEAMAESLLPQSEPTVRQILSMHIISRAANARKFDRALRFLNQFPPGQGFPYGAATELMLLLPPERNAQKQEIFQRAMASDREAYALVIGGDDFVTMIVRFWRHLPPPMVLGAIRQVLDEAQSDKSPITLMSASADASFNSAYEYRLFEVLPILRELDDAEADKLLETSVQARTQLQQLPNGVQSLDPTVRDTALKNGERSDMRGMVGTQGLGHMLQQAKGADMYNARLQEIVHMAEADPRRAIAAAASLSNSAAHTDLRGEALLAIARVTMRSNPSAARDALEQMIESLKDVNAFRSHRGLTSCWEEAIDISVQIGEIELAKRLLKSGLEQAEKLRARDADEDDPNIALKASWPSAFAFSRLVLAASQISPQTALDAVTEVSDPELQLLCEIRLANKRLGVPSGRSTITTRKKSSSRDSAAGSQG